MERLRQSTAPKQYLGFSLQTNRLLWHLLRARPGDVVSLEVLGDVAVTSPSGSTEVEETKSRSNGSSNPVANRSVELWKTLRNWIDAVARGVLNPEHTTFTLYTSRQFTSRFLEELISLRTQNASAAFLDKVCGELWGPAPSFPYKRTVAVDLQPHLERVFSQEGRDLLGKILPNFSYKFGTQLPAEEILESLRMKAIADEALGDVLFHLLGWVKDRTDQLISSGYPAYISQSDFHHELVSFVVKIHSRHILHSFAPAPPGERVEQELATSIYVTQLDLIEADDDDKLRAIADHFRAETDRIEWAEKGWVNRTTFVELEDELVRAWKSHERIIGIGHRDKPEADRGKLLFEQCSLHKCPVQGSEAPPHFLRGSFHVLADELTIGWHPNYRSLIKSPEES